MARPDYLVVTGRGKKAQLVGVVVTRTNDDVLVAQRMAHRAFPSLTGMWLVPYPFASDRLQLQYSEKVDPYGRQSRIKPEIRPIFHADLPREAKK